MPQVSSKPALARRAAAIGGCLLLTACGGLIGDSMGEESGGSAADYPSDTVTILCSSEPGSPVDTMARTLADAMDDSGFGSPVVVETVTGGDGAVALSSIVDGPADGYTLYAMTRSQSVLLASGDLDAVQPDDLEYLTRLQDDPYIWVTRTDSPFDSMKDVEAWSQDHPGELTVGGFGAKSAHQLSAARIAQEASIDMTWVPYEGGSEAVTGLLGGDVDIANTNPGSVLEQVEAGKLEILGIASEQRLDSIPDVPTFKEQGIDYVESHWRGVVTGAGTPDAVAGELEDALEAAFETPRFQKLLTDQVVLPGFMPSGDFREYVLGDIETSKSLLADVES